MLAQSESKQQGELALRISQVIGDFEAQRLADLSRIQEDRARSTPRSHARGRRAPDLRSLMLTSAKQK